MTLVSVIVPTYFRNDQLRSALESVRGQSYDRIETVVVDDSGEEHARSVVPADRDDLAYVAHDENEGAHAARDTGLGHTRGDYVQFLDEDDRLGPEKIARQVDLLEADENAGVAYCGLEYDDGIRHRPNPAVRGDVLEHALRFYDHPLTTSTMLIDATVLDEVRPLYRESAGADDIRLSIELARLTEFDFLDEILVTAERSDDSRGMSWGGIEGRWDILDDYEDLYQTVPRGVRDEAVSETYQLQGRRYLEDHVWSPSAIYSFAQALRYSPTVTSLLVGEFVSSLGGRPCRNLGRLIVR